MKSRYILAIGIIIMLAMFFTEEKQADMRMEAKYNEIEAGKTYPKEFYCLYNGEMEKFRLCRHENFYNEIENEDTLVVDKTTYLGIIKQYEVKRVIKRSHNA